MSLFILKNIDYSKNDPDIGEIIKADLETKLGTISILEWATDRQISRIDSHIRYHENLLDVFTDEELEKENIISQIHDQLQEYLDRLQ